MVGLCVIWLLAGIVGLTQISIIPGMMMVVGAVVAGITEIGRRVTPAWVKVLQTAQSEVDRAYIMILNGQPQILISTPRKNHLIPVPAELATVTL